MTKIALRPPEQVMKLARIGAFHASRLSFMRVLLRNMAAEGWRFERRKFEIDAKGVGRAVYTAHGPRRAYSLVAFAHDLPDDMRSDRVIATAWDATFCMFDGIPDETDLDRLAKNVPLQEAGRITSNELSLSRANRSVRLWAHVVESLAKGQQPDAKQIDAVGYLMRTTAVYGSGKFGAADNAWLAPRTLTRAPFAVEMLSVYLTRSFIADLVEHMAKQISPKAATLDPALRRKLGIGNSTGLGMAPFLMNHPALLNAWVTARETALARVRSLDSATPETIAQFNSLLARAQVNVANWRTDHALQIGRIQGLSSGLARLVEHIAQGGLNGPQPWNSLYLWAEGALAIEAQEQLVSLMIEPHGELVDDLAAHMGADETACHMIDGAMTLTELRAILDADYQWALTPDYTERAASARFWYVSEEKLEPRLGERFDEDGSALEQPLATGRDIAAMSDHLADLPGDTSLADFLLQQPEHRHVVRRIQLAQSRPYSEVRDNLIAADMLPIDLLRCKLSFFGAQKFDPRSDRWVRICMFQNAPYPHELTPETADDWAYPTLAGDLR